MAVVRSDEDIPASVAAEEHGPICGVCNLGITSKSLMAESICRHLFHRICISNHLRNNANCPVCNTRITKDPSASTTQPAKNKPTSPMMTRSGSKAKAFDSNRTTDSVSVNLSQQSTIPATSNLTTAASNITLNNIEDIVSRILAGQQSQLLSNLSSQISQQVERSVEASFARLNLNSAQNLNTSSPNSNRPPGMQTLPDVEQRTLEQLLGLPPTNRNANTSHNNSSSANRSNINTTSTISDLLFRPDKVSQIMFNWKLKFSGGPNCLPVDGFIYRVEALTNQTLGGNFEILCGNASALFEGKANDWFWRFHKTVTKVTWPQLCDALRRQYKDSRTDVDYREMIRDRRQKPHESFDSFYESVIDLVDRLEQPLNEKTLVEILRRNLLPEIQHEILNMTISSIGQLREICRRREFFMQDVHRKHGLSNNKFGHLQKRLSELGMESEEAPELLTPGDVVEEITLTCWNCRLIGHRYQDCIAERSVFCYGCGEPQTYKPNCRKCNRVPKNFPATAPKGAINPSTGHQKPEMK